MSHNITYLIFSYQEEKHQKKKSTLAELTGSFYLVLFTFLTLKNILLLLSLGFIIIFHIINQLKPSTLQPY